VSIVLSPPLAVIVAAVVAFSFASFLSCLKASILALSSTSASHSQISCGLTKGSSFCREEEWRYVPGTTSSIFNGERLNGSCGSLRRIERMVDLSTELREVGRMTGSSIRVASNGSKS